MNTAPAHRFHRIFIGPLGLRTGWSLLIYIAMLVPAILAVRAILPAQSTAQDPHTPLPIRGVIINEAINFAALFVVSWLMALIERRRLSAFGLGGQRPVGRFFLGAFWGLAAMSLLIASLYALHLLRFDTLLLHGVAILGWGAMLLFASLLVGLLEEYVFRGYLQFTLTRGLIGISNRISPMHGHAIAFWIASFVTATIFSTRIPTIKVKTRSAFFRSSSWA
jgi:membrane protease YdiL (CAAX protease family)